jgi:hypothetical protein
MYFLFASLREASAGAAEESLLDLTRSQQISLWKGFDLPVLKGLNSFWGDFKSTT